MVRLFADDRRFWILAAFVLGVVALLKGLRLPNRWSATQAQVDYSHGFVKRGLFGALFTGPLHLQHYARFAAFSWLVLGLLFVLLAVFVVKSGVRQRLGNGEVVALFFASYSVTYLAHTVGYFDILLAALAVFALLFRSAVVRMAVAVPVCIAGLLFHELFLVVFVPVLVLSFVLQALSATGERDRVRLLAMAGTLLGVAILTTIGIASRPSLQPAQADAMQSEIAARTDFAVEPKFFEVMTLSAESNLHIMTPKLHGMIWIGREMRSAFVFLPTLALLLLAIAKVLHHASLLPGAALWIAFAVALSPLAMNLMGDDTARWNGLLVCNAFLVLLAVCFFTEGAHVALSVGYRNAAVLAIALSMASGGLLLDGAEAHYFPFDSQAVRAWRIMQHPHEGIAPQ